MKKIAKNNVFKSGKICFKYVNNKGKKKTLKKLIKSRQPLKFIQQTEIKVS